jgi:uncharacterized membrane protein
MSTSLDIQSSYAPPAPSSSSLGERVARLTGIDVIRGAVMVLMAIDHVRVYSGVPAGGPTPGVFFTRWVTHFCAPAFVFFAGTAAFLYGRKLGDKPALSRFLLTRGLVLVALELTVIHASWRFSVDYSSALGGVIWMLGWCMVLMAGLVRFSPKAVGFFGLVVIVAQTLMRLLATALPALSPLWKLLYLGGAIEMPGFTFFVLYNIVPWIGVMAAGYGFGAVMVRAPEARRRFCLRVGLGATIAFIVLATTRALVSGGDGDGTPLLFRILEQNKYRDSQLFLLMTLGPVIALLPFVESARGWLPRVLATFGRVPMFYYLLHIPLIHATALIAWYLRDATVHTNWFATAPYVQVPENQRWGLGLLYLVFAIDVAMLYPLCAWYARAKAERPRGWMRFI